MNFLDFLLLHRKFGGVRVRTCVHAPLCVCGVCVYVCVCVCVCVCGVCVYVCVCVRVRVWVHMFAV